MNNKTHPETRIQLLFLAKELSIPFDIEDIRKNYLILKSLLENE